MGLPPREKGPQRQMFGPFCVEADEDPVSLLSKEGLSPEDIDAVILSHLHSDHCWNVSLFRVRRSSSLGEGGKQFFRPDTQPCSPIPTFRVRYTNT